MEGTCGPRYGWLPTKEPFWEASTGERSRRSTRHVVATKVTDWWYCFLCQQMLRDPEIAGAYPAAFVESEAAAW